MLNLFLYLYMKSAPAIRVFIRFDIYFLLYKKTFKIGFCLQILLELIYIKLGIWHSKLCQLGGNIFLYI